MTCTRCGQQTRTGAPACLVCAALDAALVNSPASGPDAIAQFEARATAGSARWPGLAAPGGLAGAGDRPPPGTGAGHDRHPGPGADDPATDSWLFELTPADQPEPPGLPLASPAATADGAPLTPQAGGAELASAAAPDGADFPTLAGTFPPVTPAPVYVPGPASGPESESAADSESPLPAWLGSPARSETPLPTQPGSAAWAETPLLARPGSAAGPETPLPTQPGLAAAARHAAPPVPALPAPAGTRARRRPLRRRALLTTRRRQLAVPGAAAGGSCWAQLP